MSSSRFSFHIICKMPGGMRTEKVNLSFDIKGLFIQGSNTNFKNWYGFNILPRNICTLKLINLISRTINFLTKNVLII